MYTIPYIESEEFFYLDVFLKLLLGLLAIALIINKSGKGNLAPTSAMDQVQNYVLGGIIGGCDLQSVGYALSVCYCIDYLGITHHWLAKTQNQEPRF